LDEFSPPCAELLALLLREKRKAVKTIIKHNKIIGGTMAHGRVAMRLSVQLREALGNYRIVEDDVVAIGVRRDEGRKLALVRSRRELAERIGDIAQAMEADAELKTEPDKQKEIDRLFAAMRYSLALHQASWPAVKIDEDPVAYRNSALGVKEKSDAFWGWWQHNVGLKRDQWGA
jgi:hypothetical protein